MQTARFTVWCNLLNVLRHLWAWRALSQKHCRTLSLLCSAGDIIKVLVQVDANLVALCTLNSTRAS